MSITELENSDFSINGYKFAVENGTVEVLQSGYYDISLFGTLMTMIGYGSDIFENVIKCLKTRDISWEMIVIQCREEVKNLSEYDMEHIMLCFPLIDESFEIDCFVESFTMDDYPDIRYGTVSEGVKNRIIDTLRENTDFSTYTFATEHESAIREYFTDYLENDAAGFERCVLSDFEGGEGFNLLSQEFITSSIDAAVRKIIDEMTGNNAAKSETTI